MTGFPESEKIGYLQVYTGYLIFSLKKNLIETKIFDEV